MWVDIIGVSLLPENAVELSQAKSGKDAVGFTLQLAPFRGPSLIPSKLLSADVNSLSIRNQWCLRNLNLRLCRCIIKEYQLIYASRNGVPLEVVSKVILRHQDLKTTQVYLGKITDSEAIRWMDILHGK